MSEISRIDDCVESVLDLFEGSEEIPDNQHSGLAICACCGSGHKREDMRVIEKQVFCSECAQSE